MKNILHFHGVTEKKGAMRSMKEKERKKGLTQKKRRITLLPSNFGLEGVTIFRVEQMGGRDGRSRASKREAGRSKRDDIRGWDGAGSISLRKMSATVPLCGNPGMIVRVIT